jgi:hypothetical protein
MRLLPDGAEEPKLIKPAKEKSMTDEEFRLRIYSRARRDQEDRPNTNIAYFRNADGTLNRQRMLDVPAMKDAFTAKEREDLLSNSERRSSNGA